MRTGIIHAAIVSAVSASVGALEMHQPRRRSPRKLIHMTARTSDASRLSSDNRAANYLSRSLGVGLDDVWQGKGKGKGKRKSKEKGKGKGKGDDPYPPGEGKGKGKGNEESPISSPMYSPVGSPVAASPTTEYPHEQSPVYNGGKKKKSPKTDRSKLSKPKSGKSDCPTDSPISSPSEDGKLRIVVISIFRTVIIKRNLGCRTLSDYFFCPLHFLFDHLRVCHLKVRL